MRMYYALLSFLIVSTLLAQEKVATDTISVDSLYREDQFYTSITYNNLQHTPTLFSQNKFSPGISVGFLRDMPLNKNRTWALAAGLGYAYSGYNTNLLQSVNSNGTIAYQIAPNTTEYSQNKLTLHQLEVPFELRWRNSTYKSHRFWRIYSGFKISYLLNSKYAFTSNTSEIIIKNSADLNKISYGATLTAGWNTWNVYVYYGLNKLFKDTQVGTDAMDLKTLNLGLQFYIL
ncbi:MAG: PorT family protein [Flavobacterium sp.]|nr:PorT family protein [Flavobacterium sp.]